MRRLGTKKLASTQPDPAVALSDDGSDISLMSSGGGGEDEGAGPSAPRVDLLDQPTTWAEVDVSELQRVALGIARSAVPELERADPDARLAVAPEADTADPLGFGFLDSRTLTLVRCCCSTTAAAASKQCSRAAGFR